jgi:hypothetical protein
MSPEELQFPAVYCDGTAYFLDRDDRFSGTYFGGPYEGTFNGLDEDSQTLHHILTLNRKIIPHLEHHRLGFGLSLFYGMQHEGCELAYRILGPMLCEVIELEPREACAVWPYPHYPRLLPYIPLRLAKRIDCTAKQFAKFAWQGLDIKPKTMAIIVPPLFVGGVSMWGRTGDAEGVQIIFECDLESETIRASNQCT